MAKKYLLLFKDNQRYYKCAVSMIDHLFKVYFLFLFLIFFLFFFYHKIMKMCSRKEIILKTFSKLLNEEKTALKLLEEWIKNLRDLGMSLNSQNVLLNF